MCRGIHGYWQQKEITNFSFGSRRRNTEINLVEFHMVLRYCFFRFFFLFFFFWLHQVGPMLSSVQKL